MVLEYSIQVICIFHELEWKIFSFDCNLTFNKERFLHNVFHRLTKEEIMNLEKISICQFCNSDEEVLPFIEECRGKLWFDITDPNDIENNRIRDEYLNIICVE